MPYVRTTKGDTYLMVNKSIKLNTKASENIYSRKITIIIIIII